MPTPSAAHRLIPHLRKVAFKRSEGSTDGQLLTAFVSAGDEAAFATLVDRHGPTVLGVCRRVVGDAHLAEDAFQATFLVLARRAATVRPREVGAWLYGVAYRTALKARTTAARRRAREQQVPAMPNAAAAPGPEATWAELQPILDEEIARLPDKYRRPLVLCDLGGRTQRDVARELGLPNTTLVRRLAAARRILAARLTERGVTLSAGAIAAALGWHAATSAVPAKLAASAVRAASTVLGRPPLAVPPQVVELSEGVLRMFLIEKLKAGATALLAGLILVAGIGFVANSDLRADPQPKGELKAPIPVAPESDDLTFLRRTSLDFRGTLPTVLEAKYFLSDEDAKKRSKVTGWMLADHGVGKTQEFCTKCHKVSVGAGVAVTDFDFDGRLDQFHAGGFDTLRNFHWRQAIGSFEDPKKADPNVKPGDAVDPRNADFTRAAKQLAELQDQLRKAEDTAQAKEIARLKVRLAAAETELGTARKKLAEWQAKSAPKAKDELQESRDFSKTIEYSIELKSDYQRYLHQLGETVSDADFLQRTVKDLAGRAPSKLEERYFAGDTDPKKREKLVEWLMGKPVKTGNAQIDDFLADPAIQKQYAAWRKARAEAAELEARKKERLANAPQLPTAITRLIADLVAAKKTDNQLLDALCLATLARFPTESERRFVLGEAAKRAEPVEFWSGVATSLVVSKDSREYARQLAGTNAPIKASVEFFESPAKSSSIDLFERVLDSKAEIEKARLRVDRFQKSQGAIPQTQIDEARIDLDLAEKRGNALLAGLEDAHMAASEAVKKAADELEFARSLVKKGFAPKAEADAAELRFRTAEGRAKRIHELFNEVRKK